MKMTKILQTVALVLVVGTLVSCSSGREYHNAPQARYSRGHVSLILTPRPGFTMSRNPDGRFFHRSSQGFVYWQGHDNRFYLDKNQVRKVRYNQREYREWKRFGKKYSKRGKY